MDGTNSKSTENLAPTDMSSENGKLNLVLTVIALVVAVVALIVAFVGLSQKGTTQIAFPDNAFPSSSAQSSSPSSGKT